MGTGTIESEHLSLEDASRDERFREIIEWIVDFLCAAHPDLGRLGDVCPFARTAVLKSSIAFFRNSSESAAALSKDVEAHLQQFQQSGATRDIYQCRIIVPTALDEPASAVEAVQKPCARILRNSAIVERPLFGNLRRHWRRTNDWLEDRHLR